MSTITFVYDYDKDAYNYVRLMLFPPRFGSNRENILLDIPHEVTEEVQALFQNTPIKHSELVTAKHHPLFEPVKNYLQKKVGMKKRIEQSITCLQSEWSKREDIIVSAFESLLERPAYPAHSTGFLSTFPSCPSFQNWFMVPAFKPLETQIYVACHEFMHLQFLHYYESYCTERGLDTKAVHELKEAITFLLNEPAFSAVIHFQDTGYASQQELRAKLIKIWKEEKKFSSFLERAIEVVSVM